MTVGFIGAGNMGGALATAVAKAVGGGSVLLADRDTDKAAALAAALGARVSDNDTVVCTCDYVFIGVKPQVVPELFREIGGAVCGRRDPFTLVSMAAGMSTDTLCGMLAADHPVPLIRIMPNTPASIGEGMILYTAVGTTDAQETEFLRIMQAAGSLSAIPERLIDAASAVSGCGPAFVYLFIEALADGGVECGLPRQTALELAARTVRGAAGMVLETGAHPGALKDAVCSPGGTTIAGVHALEAGGFRSLAMDAVVASYDRTLELMKK